MLSILIPTFNYNTYPLVRELYNQCIGIENLTFEIIVLDDASENIHENELINSLPHCLFLRNTTNQGSSLSRNNLIEKASYEWCLFLDDDIWPTSTNFILNYINEIKSTIDTYLFYGGLKYSNNKPKNSELLRWLYGKKYEANTYKDRIKKKPNHFLCSNLLVKKSILLEFTFPVEIKTYGYEDLIFNLKIIENKKKISQIDNAVLHKKLDTSEQFLNKTKNALDNLSKSIHDGLLPKNATQISKLYYRINQKWIVSLIKILFRINQNWMRKVLISKHTNLTLFNIYRVSYFYSIHK